ncbi:MAG: NUDIX hydrolase [Pseudomonadota bacterium]
MKSTGKPTPSAPSRRYPSAPMIGVCAAVWRGDKVCLVRRAAQPSAGLWAQPGGLVELGETLIEAVTREVREETRLVIESPVFNTYIDIILHDDAGAVERHFVLAMFAAVSHSGLAVAGDDAAALGWFTLDEMAGLPLTGDSLNLVRASRALVD